MIKSEIKKTEFDLFNKLSEEWWDENGKFKILHEIRPLRIKYILRQFKAKNIKNLEILDLGCGGGLVSESLARLEAKVTGVDFVGNNIKIAKKHAKSNNLKINYIKSDIEELNIKKKFDVVILFEILEHLDDWKFFLNKLNKVVKNNGLIIISTINKNFLSKFFAIKVAENILKWIPKNTHNYEKFIQPEELINIMEDNNSKLIDLSGMIFNPINFKWFLSKNTKINYFCTFKKIN